MIKRSFVAVYKLVNIFYVNIISNLKYKLLIFFILVCIIPILITGTIIYKMTSEIFLEKVKQNSTEMIMKKVSYFDSSFMEIDKILSLTISSYDTLSFLKEVDDNNIRSSESLQIVDRIAAQMDYLISLKTEIVNSIMLLPVEKNKYPISRGKLNYVTGFAGDYRESDIFKRTINGKNQVEWMFSSQDNGSRYIVTASSSILNHTDMEKLGIAVVFLNMDQIKDIFESAKPQQGEIMLVIDKNNNIIYDTDFTRVGKKYNEISVLSYIKNSDSDSGSFDMEINGQKKIVIYYTSLNTGWKIINMVPYNNIKKSIGVLSMATFNIALISLIFVTVLALLFYQNMYTPIKKLSVSMNKLGEGNLEIHLSTKKTDEIGVLINRFNFMTSRISVLIDNVREEQRQKKENEIKALQSQITPHFLYNTLNSVKTLVEMERNKDANEMIIALINLLKTCAKNTNKFVTIQEELYYVKSYVMIMEFRSDRKFTVTYEVDFNLLDCKILKFTLQPLIENCIIHAFDNAEKDNSINIQVNKNNDAIEIAVHDNGVGMDNDTANKYLNCSEDSFKSRFNNIGINNINERIKLNYGTHYGVSIQSALGEGTTVLISIPYLKHD